jgi:hypothetical protein
MVIHSENFEENYTEDLRLKNNMFTQVRTRLTECVSPAQADFGS